MVEKTVAVEILDVHLHPIRDREDTILFYIERTPLTTTSLLVRYTMCILFTQCFTESVSLRYISKPHSGAEKSSPISLYIKAVKGAHLGSALTLYRHRWSSGPLIEKKTVGIVQTCFFFTLEYFFCDVL